jgi:hypothetical protein
MMARRSWRVYVMSIRPQVRSYLMSVLTRSRRQRSDYPIPPDAPIPQLRLALGKTIPPMCAMMSERFQNERYA